MRLAARGSPLARWQADRVAALLRALPGAPAVEIVTVHTTGDRLAEVSLAALAGQGVFVTEVQQAVLSGEADLAVHSAKDLPSATPEGLVIAAVPERADPRDALAGSTLRDLRPGALVGTGSPRRRAQLAWMRPDLRFTELRGNIGTRLGRVGSVDVVVVAQAALDRLDLATSAAEVLSPALMLPQVAQGALAVECRAGDAGVRDLLARIDDAAVHRAVDAERSFLAAVGGGCRAAIGALARPAGPGAGAPGGSASEGGLADADSSTGADSSEPAARALVLDAMVASPDGRIVLRCRVTGTEPLALGRAAHAELVERRGASLVLDPQARA